MQRPGNLNGGASWFGEFNGRGGGRGRGRGRGKRPAGKRGMRKGMRKLMPGAPKKCGWFCRMRRRWQGLPPVPPAAPIIVETPAPATPEDIISDTTGVDPTVNGYFGDWSYF